MMDPLKPRRRVTLADVAEAAGVSLPTVDRVLNRRAPVKPETARRVQDAATALGFHASRLLAHRLEAMRPSRKLGFLLQRSSSAFYRNLAAELHQAVRNPALGHHGAIVEHLDDLTPAHVAERLVRLGNRCDAVGVVAADHPKVNAAIERLHAEGRPVYALLSDVSSEACAGSFGMDHRKAGRTAGWALARLARPGSDLAIVVGNHRYLGHELCEISFRSYLREQAPGFRLLEPLASFEDRRFAYEATLDLFRRSPGLGGLYVPGGGIEGIIEALRERPAAASKVVVVAMDLFAETREALTEGLIDLVLATPVRAVADGVVAAMLARLDGIEAVPQRMSLPFEIYVPENI